MDRKMLSNICMEPRMISRYVCHDMPCIDSIIDGYMQI